VKNMNSPSTFRLIIANFITIRIRRSAAPSSRMKKVASTQPRSQKTTIQRLLSRRISILSTISITFRSIGSIIKGVRVSLALITTFHHEIAALEQHQISNNRPPGPTFELVMIARCEVNFRSCHRSRKLEERSTKIIIIKITVRRIPIRAAPSSTPIVV